MARFSTSSKYGRRIAASFVSSFRIVCGLGDDGEVLVAVEQAQAVDRRRIAVAVVVAHLELPPRFVLLPEPHQVDPELRSGRPQTRIEIDGLAIVGDAFVVAVFQHEVRRDQRVALAVDRIDLQHPLDPRVRRPIRQQLHRRVDGHRVEGIGRRAESPRRPASRLRPRWSPRARGWRAARALRPASDSSSSAFSAYSRAFRSKPSAPTSARPRYASAFFGSRSSASVNSFGGLGVVEALVEQAAPADAVERVPVGARHGGPEFVVGVLVQLEAPVALGAEVRIGGQRQRLIAGLRLGAATVIAERRAVGWRAGGVPRHADTQDEHHRQRQERPDSPHSCAPYLSSVAWTRASSTSSAFSCCS